MTGGKEISMTQAQRDAINLLLEDLHIPHSDIRCLAKQQNCEKELDEYQREVVLFLLKKVTKDTE